MNFYRTLITLEVLSEEPIPADADVSAIVEEATTGAYSMIERPRAEEKIDGPTTAAALIAQGSDPSFFQLDDAGNKLAE